jgi:hypothetical protein
VAQIQSFIATPATITAGNSSTLTWSVTGAATLSIDPAPGPVTGTSQAITPSQTTTYTLTATDAAGRSVTQQTIVTVAAMPTIDSFTAAAQTIRAGNSTTLTAKFSGGDGVVDHGVSSVASGTPIGTGTLGANATFTLTVTNTAGTSATAMVTVTVVPKPTIKSFVAAANPVFAGQTATLTATFDGVRGVVVPFIGQVASGMPYPTDIIEDPIPVTYTLTVSNAANDVATATLQIGAKPNSFTAVSSGGSFTCGLKADKTIACRNTGSTGASSPTGTFTSVSTGGRHACGVQTDGTVACWGDNTDGGGKYFGQATPPIGVLFSSVGAGGNHTCGLKTDGTIVCWGSNVDETGTSTGQATPPAGTYVALSVGYSHNCAMKADGTIVCWGNNTYGQSTPAAGSFQVVSAGGEAFGVEFTCVLQTDKTVTCWGDNYAGYGSPCTPPAGTLFSSISTGSLHSCGLKTDNTVACWGDNYYGQATPPAGTFIAVSAGGAQTCGIKAADSTIACWPDQHVVF